MNEESCQADICIIGAGVAGAAMACSLAGSGKQVCVVEKDWKEPDRIVGELLQPDGIEQLAEMGLKPMLEGYDAQDIIGYTIIHSHRPIHIDYPGSKTGKGMRNGKFIQKMRSAFSAGDNIRCFEAEAKSLIRNKDGGVAGVECSGKTGGSFAIQADLTIVADGIFSSFRKQLVRGTGEVTGYFLGFLLKGCSLPFEGRGHVFLTDPSPFLCYPISGDEIRFLVDFPKGKPPKRGGELVRYLNERVRSRIPEGMHAAFDACMEEGAFKAMPNHYLPSKAVPADGILVLGDALNMRHPLTGGGMTVCLRDVNTCAGLLRSMEIATPQQRLALARKFYGSRTQNTVVNVLADALYNVMGNQKLRDACFHYLAEGGKQAEESIALLSGLDKRRVSLLKHFVSLAAKSGWGGIKRQRSLSSATDAYHLTGEAYRIISPLLQNELKSKPLQAGLGLAGTLFKSKAS